VPAVAVKVAEVRPGPTNTAGATGNSGLLLLKDTEMPPVPAGLEIVTVQVVAAPDPRLVGEQLNRFTTVGATSEMPADCELPFSDAVTETVWSEAMVPAVAVNVEVLEPAATLTDAGTVSNPLLLLSDTDTPPVPAAFDSVTVQDELAPEVRLVGAQESCVTNAGAIREMPADWELPFSDAVTEAV